MRSDNGSDESNGTSVSGTDRPSDVSAERLADPATLGAADTAPYAGPHRAADVAAVDAAIVRAVTDTHAAAHHEPDAATEPRAAMRRPGRARTPTGTRSMISRQLSQR